MQQETLLQQLQVNREQMLAAREELNSAHLTEDQRYDLWVHVGIHWFETGRKIISSTQYVII